MPIFNPASDATQVSRLRLINPGDAAAAVTIGGRDDSGAVATGGDVTLTLAAGGAQTLTAQQLEAGDSSVTGQLGAGTGRWRLTVSSDQPLQVVNIVAATAGYWNNLSTTAVPGAAPAGLEAFNERFVGNAVVYVTSSDRFTLNAQTGERFTETAEIDGVATTYMGSYGYAGIGPDAGRLTVTYDDGDVCAANLYFSTHTAGWFASHCTGSDYPADGTWLGGSWSVEDDEGDGGEVTDTMYGVDDALPGVPTSGQFEPATTSGASVTATADGTTIELNDGGYFELSDGTRYTCTSADGCAVANGTVTRGTVAGRAAGDGEVDRFPTFRTAVSPTDQTYTVGTAIDALTLPEASGGNGTLAYSLSPNVAGLTFSASTRQLTGTPSTAGTNAMTYTVTDEDDDTDTLGFTITVNTDTTETGSLGECYVSLSVSIGQSCTYPGTTDAFSVNERGRGSFLTFLAGIRIRITNQTINGRVYEFEASHQGEGVWRIDRVAGSTEVPETPPMTGGGGMEPVDTAPSFAADAGPGNQTYTVDTAIDALTLPEASGGAGSLTYTLTPEVAGLSFNATTRQLTGTPTTAASYNMTYTATDEDDDSDSLTFTITIEESNDDGDSGSGTTYGVGDTLSDLPTGTSWVPEQRPGWAPYVASGTSRIQFDNGYYIDVGGYRYTCRSDGGCGITNREVVSGTILQTSTAGIRFTDRFPDSRLVHVYNDNVIVMHIAEGVRTTPLRDSLIAYAADFYQWFEDEFDYLVFLSNLSTIEEGSSIAYSGRYNHVMNDTEGIGLSKFLNSSFGSAGRLRGVIHLKWNNSLRYGPFVHELLHAWANYAVPTVDGAHWGFSSANGLLGGFDIANLMDLGDGRWTAGRFHTNGNYGTPFSPIELYLAGLASRDEVPDLWVAEDRKWLLDENGAPITTDNGDRIFTAENVNTWTIDEIVSENGERNPPMAERRHQRAAAILLVDDDHLPSVAVLQTVSEHANWIGEQGDNGTAGQDNYYEATGGRGSLTLAGLSGLRKSEAAAPADLPASFGVAPPPRMTTMEELCGPSVPTADTGACHPYVTLTPKRVLSR